MSTLNDRSEKEQLFWELSDAHKDAYGFRPRGFYDPDTMTEEQIRQEIARCYSIIEENFKLEKQQFEISAKVFEQRVAKTIESGAGSRASALRWILAADGAQDWEHLCYINGLDYGYFDAKN